MYSLGLEDLRGDDETTSYSYGQVMRSEDAALWHEAIQEELTSLYRARKCWEYVPYPPKGTQLLNAHFLCKKKLRLGKVI